MLKKLIVYCILFYLPCFVSAKIVFISDRDGGHCIYVMDDDGSNVHQLTFRHWPKGDSRPRWSPDGTRIGFGRDVGKGEFNQQYELFLMDSDGGNVQQLTDNSAFDGMDTWAPDGRRIAFTSSLNGGFDIYVMDILTRKVKQLTRNPGNREWAKNASWSPNGKLIAYVQAINGGFLNSGQTIYVMNADGSRKKELVPADMDWSRSFPRWSPDSKSVLYSESRIRFGGVGQIRKLASNNVVIQRHNSKTRRVLNIPQNWLVSFVCWMDDGKQVLITAREGIGEQYDIYRYHLVTGKITNLTNSPEDETSMDWISDDVLSVTPQGKIKLKWGTLKK